MTLERRHQPATDDLSIRKQRGGGRIAIRPLPDGGVRNARA